MKNTGDNNITTLVKALNEAVDAAFGQGLQNISADLEKGEDSRLLKANPEGFANVLCDVMQFHGDRGDEMFKTELKSVAEAFDKLRSFDKSAVLQEIRTVASKQLQTVHGNEIKANEMISTAKGKTGGSLTDFKHEIKEEIEESFDINTDTHTHIGEEMSEDGDEIDTEGVAEEIADTLLYGEEKKKGPLAVVLDLMNNLEIVRKKEGGNEKSIVPETLNDKDVVKLLTGLNRQDREGFAYKLDQEKNEEKQQALIEQELNLSEKTAPLQLVNACIGLAKLRFNVTVAINSNDEVGALLNNAKKKFNKVEYELSDVSDIIGRKLTQGSSEEGLKKLIMNAKNHFLSEGQIVEIDNKDTDINKDANHPTPTSSPQIKRKETSEEIRTDSTSEEENKDPKIMIVKKEGTVDSSSSKEKSEEITSFDLEKLLDNWPKGEEEQKKALEQLSVALEKRLVDPNMLIVDENNKKQPAIMYAVSKKNTAVVEVLCKAKGINVNAQNEDGGTALHRAVIFKNRDVVVALLEAGADITIKAKNRITPYGLAKEDNELEKLLRESFENRTKKQEENDRKILKPIAGKLCEAIAKMEKEKQKQALKAVNTTLGTKNFLGKDGIYLIEESSKEAEKEKEKMLNKLVNGIIDKFDGNFENFLKQVKSQETNGFRKKNILSDNHPLRNLTFSETGELKNETGSDRFSERVKEDNERKGEEIKKQLEELKKQNRLELKGKLHHLWEEKKKTDPENKKTLQGINNLIFMMKENNQKVATKDEMREWEEEWLNEQKTGSIKTSEVPKTEVKKESFNLNKVAANSKLENLKLSLQGETPEEKQNYLKERVDSAIRSMEKLPENHEYRAHEEDLKEIAKVLAESKLSEQGVNEVHQLVKEQSAINSREIKLAVEGVKNKLNQIKKKDLNLPESEVKKITPPSLLSDTKKSPLETFKSNVTSWTPLLKGDDNISEDTGKIQNAFLRYCDQLLNGLSESQKNAFGKDLVQVKEYLDPRNKLTKETLIEITNMVADFNADTTFKEMSSYLSNPGLGGAVTQLIPDPNPKKSESKESDGIPKDDKKIKFTLNEDPTPVVTDEELKKAVLQLKIGKKTPPRTVNLETSTDVDSTPSSPVPSPKGSPRSSSDIIKKEEEDENEDEKNAYSEFQDDVRKQVEALKNVGEGDQTTLDGIQAKLGEACDSLYGTLTVSVELGEDVKIPDQLEAVKNSLRDKENHYTKSQLVRITEIVAENPKNIGAIAKIVGITPMGDKGISTFNSSDIKKGYGVSSFDDLDDDFSDSSDSEEEEKEKTLLKKFKSDMEMLKILAGVEDANLSKVQSTGYLYCKAFLKGELSESTGKRKFPNLEQVVNLLGNKNNTLSQENLLEIIDMASKLNEEQAVNDEMFKGMADYLGNPEFGFVTKMIPNDESLSSDRSSKSSEESDKEKQPFDQGRERELGFLKSWVVGYRKNYISVYKGNALFDLQGFIDKTSFAKEKESLGTIYDFVKEMDTDSSGVITNREQFYQVLDLMVGQFGENPLSQEQLSQRLKNLNQPFVNEEVKSREKKDNRGSGLGGTNKGRSGRSSSSSDDESSSEDLPPPPPPEISDDESSSSEDLPPPSIVVRTRQHQLNEINGLQGGINTLLQHPQGLNPTQQQQQLGQRLGNFIQNLQIVYNQLDPQQNPHNLQKAIEINQMMVDLGAISGFLANNTLNQNALGNLDQVLQAYFDPIFLLLPQLQEGADQRVSLMLQHVVGGGGVVSINQPQPLHFAQQQFPQGNGGGGNNVGNQNIPLVLNNYPPIQPPFGMGQQNHGGNVNLPGGNINQINNFVNNNPNPNININLNGVIGMRQRVDFQNAQDVQGLLQPTRNALLQSLTQPQLQTEQTNLAQRLVALSNGLDTFANDPNAIPGHKLQAKEMVDSLRPVHLLLTGNPLTQPQLNEVVESVGFYISQIYQPQPGIPVGTVDPYITNSIQWITQPPLQRLQTLHRLLSTNPPPQGQYLTSIQSRLVETLKHLTPQQLQGVQNLQQQLQGNAQLTVQQLLDGVADIQQILQPPPPQQQQFAPITQQERPFANAVKTNIQGKLTAIQTAINNCMPLPVGAGVTPEQVDEAKLKRLDYSRTLFAGLKNGDPHNPEGLLAGTGLSFPPPTGNLPANDIRALVQNLAAYLRGEEPFNNNNYGQNPNQQQLQQVGGRLQDILKNTLENAALESELTAKTEEMSLIEKRKKTLEQTQYDQSFDKTKKEIEREKHQDYKDADRDAAAAATKKAVIGGVLAGAVIGFAVGGPIGAVVGMFIGGLGGGAAAKIAVKAKTAWNKRQVKKEDAAIKNLGNEMDSREQEHSKLVEMEKKADPKVEPQNNLPNMTKRGRDDATIKKNGGMTL